MAAVGRVAGLGTVAACPARFASRDGGATRKELHLTQLSIAEFWYLVNMLLYDNCHSDRQSSFEQDEVPFWAGTNPKDALP
jgi:hypothetical protein